MSPKNWLICEKYGQSATALTPIITPKPAILNA